MDAERSLISKILTTGQIESVVSRGVATDHFAQEDCRDVYDTMIAHLLKYRAVPSTNVIRTAHPEFGFDVVTDPLDYIFDEFVKGLKRRKAIESGRRLMQAIDNPEFVATIDEIFLEEARHLTQLLPSPKVAYYSKMFERIDDYKASVDAGETPMGITFGVPVFDEATYGIQSHEFVVVAGWQGLGKSTLAQHMLYNAYLEGKTAMIISLEMESSALLRKWDVMSTQIEYKRLKSLALGREDLDKWEKAAAKAAKAKNDIIILDDLGRNCTVEKVYSEIVRYKPDIVCVDYITLLSTPSHAGQAIWEKVTWLTREFKAMCRSLCTPVIGIVQTNIGSVESGATLDTIAYSRSIGQDADIVLGLHQDKDGKMHAQKKMEVRLLKNRDGEKTQVDMFWNPAKMEFREWRPADMFLQREHHTPEDSPIIDLNEHRDRKDDDEPEIQAQP